MCAKTERLERLEKFDCSRCCSSATIPSRRSTAKSRPTRSASLEPSTNASSAGGTREPGNPGHSRASVAQRPRVIEPRAMGSRQGRGCRARDSECEPHVDQAPPSNNPTLRSSITTTPSAPCSQAAAVLELRELGLRSAFARPDPRPEALAACVPIQEANKSFIRASRPEAKRAPPRPPPAAPKPPPPPKSIAKHLESGNLDRLFSMTLPKGPTQPRLLPLARRWPLPPPVSRKISPPGSRPKAPVKPHTPARPMSKGRSAAANRRPKIDGPRLSPSILTRTFALTYLAKPPIPIARIQGRK